MSEHHIRQSGEVAQQILSVLEKFQIQMMDALNNLKELPNLLKKVLEGISESAARQIKAAGEMEIIKKMANLNAKRYLISAENEAIHDFKTQLNEDIELIKNRYSKLNDELDSEANKRVNELDSHLLDLPNHFPDSFILGYTRNISPLMQKISEDVDLSLAERSMLINDTINRVIESLSTFLKSRNDFFVKINDYQQDEKPTTSMVYHMPIWVFKNERQTHLFPKGKINLDKSFSNASYFVPDSKLENYYNLLSKEKVDDIITDLEWKTNTSIKNKMNERLLSFADQNFTKNKTHIKRAVNRIIKESDIKLKIR
mgnify:CR=1 FL=1